MRGCDARQYSDQMVCDSCGYAWDTNDTDPPSCKTNKQKALSKLEEIRERLSIQHTDPERVKKQSAEASTLLEVLNRVNEYRAQRDGQYSL